MKTGFYFYTPRVDYFFESENLDKTPGKMRLIDSILTNRFLCRYRGQSGLWPVKELLEPATIEQKESKFGRYFSIRGLRRRFFAGNYRNRKRIEIINL